MQGIRISEEAELTANTNKPEPETPETPAPQPEPECTALVPTEPDVIEGEVIEIEQPEISEDHIPPKQTPYWLLIPLTILLCLLFVAASSLVPLLSPSATITILPVEKNLSLTDSMKVQGRELPPLTLMQSTTAPATGKRHQDATRAHGTITLYNGLLTSQTIPAGTIFTDHRGVQIITDQAAVIPAGNPPSYGQVSVPAHAVFAGPQGNIPAYAINTACCATSVVAKNTGAFSGGAAAREYLVVTRTDINNAVTSLLVTLSQSEDAALQVQLHPGEALITPTCTPHVASDHRPGDEAKHVSVTIAVTCIGIAYAANTLYQDATQLLTLQAATTFGATYSLIGDIQVTIVHASITDHTQGIATLALKMDATYLYQIRPSEKVHLSSLLAGKPKQQAITTLLQSPGIQAASIHLAGGDTTLPTDPHHIQIIVMYRGN